MTSCSQILREIFLSFLREVTTSVSPRNSLMPQQEAQLRKPLIRIVIGCAALLERLHPIPTKLGGRKLNSVCISQSCFYIPSYLVFCLLPRFFPSRNLGCHHPCPFNQPLVVKRGQSQTIGARLRISSYVP